MKTQEEIEQLAESKYKYSGNVHMAELVQTKRVHFTKGYTQCQKDNAKRYTKKELENAFNSGRGYGVPDDIIDFKGYYAYKDDTSLYGLDIYLMNEKGGSTTMEVYFKTKENWLSVLRLLDENM